MSDKKAKPKGKKFTPAFRPTIARVIAKDKTEVAFHLPIKDIIYGNDFIQVEIVLDKEFLETFFK